MTGGSLDVGRFDALKVADGVDEGGDAGGGHPVEPSHTPRSRHGVEPAEPAGIGILPAMTRPVEAVGAALSAESRKVRTRWTANWAPGKRGSRRTARRW